MPPSLQRKVKHFVSKGSGKNVVRLGETFAGLGEIGAVANKCLQAAAVELGVQAEDMREVRTEFFVEHDPHRMGRLASMHKDLPQAQRPQVFKDPLSSLISR